MSKNQWMVLDSWPVGNKYRVIFKMREAGANLVDITLENTNIEEIIHKVVNSSWTIKELIDYLNTQSGHY